MGNCKLRPLVGKKEWRKPGKEEEEKKRQEGTMMAVDDSRNAAWSRNLRERII